jgi:ribonuclease HI
MKIVKRLACALLFCLSVPAPWLNATGAKSFNPLEQALVADSQAVAEAQKAKDIESLKRLLTDDFEQVGSEGGLHSKGDVIGDAKDGLLKDYSLYQFAVLPVDENAAIVTYNAIIQTAEGDEPGQAPRYQHFSDLWVKQGEQWRLRFEQSTPLRHID